MLSLPKTPHIWTKEDFDNSIDIDELWKPINFQANTTSRSLKTEALSDSFTPLLEET